MVGSILAALLAWVGLIHSYTLTPTDTVVHLGWGTGRDWAIGYGLLAVLFAYAAWQGRSKQVE